MSDELLVTVVGPADTVDVVVPAHIPVEELLGDLVASTCPDGGTDWRPERSNRPIDTTMSLAQTGVLDGERITLAAPTGAGLETDEYNDRPPCDRVGVELPTPIGPVQRLVMVAREIGHRTRPGDVITRAREVWHWTDHHNRLRWLIGYPSLLRTVTIGVMGPGSDDVASALGLALREGREGPVVIRRDTSSGEVADIATSTQPGSIVVTSIDRTAVQSCDQVVCTATPPLDVPAGVRLIGVDSTGPSQMAAPRRMRLRLPQDPTEPAWELAVIVVAGWHDLGRAERLPAAL